MTHICVSKLTIIASDNGLSPGRRQAIIWTSDGILLIGFLKTNFSEILIEIITFSFKKMRLKVSSAKWRPCCLGLNVLSPCRVVRSHSIIWLQYVFSVYFILLCVLILLNTLTIFAHLKAGYSVTTIISMTDPGSFLRQIISIGVNKFHSAYRLRLYGYVYFNL